MNKRQKKKLFKKMTRNNPPEWLSYSGKLYHSLIEKPWGGLAELKKQETIRAVEDFNRNIQDRNVQIRALRRYTR